jgi:hypothetical protein
MLYDSATSLASYTIFSMCTVASCSLFSRTSGGVLGVNFSVNSVISCLYHSFSSIVAGFSELGFVLPLDFSALGLACTYFAVDNSSSTLVVLIDSISNVVTSSNSTKFSNSSIHSFFLSDCRVTYTNLLGAQTFEGAI